ncbi:hypothetical protein CLU79DRAFT_843571 [Phycomyces nitens]|nr:hypothetical protein CLU79DRAFT_843571 [Phycomyces nitens]
MKDIAMKREPSLGSHHAQPHASETTRQGFQSLSEPSTPLPLGTHTRRHRMVSGPPGYRLSSIDESLDMPNAENGMGPPFGIATEYESLVSTDNSRGIRPRLWARMDRGFFLQELEWTCYRRNYFQVSASFDFEGELPDVGCVVKSTGEPVQSFAVNLRAHVTEGGRNVELVQHTPKRDKGPQRTPEPCTLRAGGNLETGGTTLGAPHTIQPDLALFERIQFKTATANNGKRRAAQQYFRLNVDLLANTATTSIRVMSIASAPLVVRGRSPGHYAELQDKSTQPPQRHRHHHRYMSLPNSPSDPYPSFVSFIPPSQHPPQHSRIDSSSSSTFSAPFQPQPFNPYMSAYDSQRPSLNSRMPLPPPPSASASSSTPPQREDGNYRQPPTAYYPIQRGQEYIPQTYYYQGQPNLKESAEEDKNMKPTTYSS